MQFYLKHLIGALEDSQMARKKREPKPEFPLAAKPLPLFEPKDLAKGKRAFIDIDERPEDKEKPDGQ